MTALNPPGLPLEAALQQAIAHHQAGRLAEAEQGYRAVLQAQPGQPDANHNLGILHCQLGRVASGLPYLKTAAAENPRNAQYTQSYAQALMACGQAQEALVLLQDAERRGVQSAALQSLQQAVEAAAQSGVPRPEPVAPVEMEKLWGWFHAKRYAELESRALALTAQYPESAFAWKILSAALQMQGKDAVPALRRTAELAPDVEAHTNLGLALQAQGKIEEAAASHRQALALAPGFHKAHFNLGVALHELGRVEEAADSYRRALQSAPDYAEAHCNLGNVLREQRQFEAAVACYRRALEIKPGLAEAHALLGVALHDLVQLEAAIASYRRALELKPDYADAHNNLGHALRERGQLQEAEACYRRALQIDPGNAKTHNNLGNVLRDVGQLHAAIASYRQALALDPDFAEAHSNLLFLDSHLRAQPAAAVLAQARRFGDWAASRATPYALWESLPATGQRLRVGLVSGDLLNHPVGFFLEALLAEIDPARIELIAYATRHDEDELTRRIRPYFSAWRTLAGQSDEAAARLIHADGLHLLLDLSGHTGFNRLSVFAWRPAPVQASWLGYFATTGVREIDYVLADEVSVPKEQQAQFTEAVCYLADTRLCFSAPPFALAVGPLPAASKKHITFGCFQNLSKVEDAVLAAWGRVFSALPDARLRMQCKQLGDPAQAQSLLARLGRHGIDPARVELHAAIGRDAYLQAHNDVDIILDTFPYPGGTTTCEALWMGVPTLTLAGDSLLSRQGASLLTAAGLAGWVAHSEDEYVSKAIAFAADLPQLAALRAGLRQQALASPLFDAPRFARNFEAALYRMWEQRG